MTDKQFADEDLWSDEICALVDAAFETVSRNPNDHEEAVAYRRAIAAALRQPTPDVLRVTDEMVKRAAIEFYNDPPMSGRSINDAMKAALTAALQEQSK